MQSCRKQRDFVNRRRFGDHEAPKEKTKYDKHIILLDMALGYGYEIVMYYSNRSLVLQIPCGRCLGTPNPHAITTEQKGLEHKGTGSTISTNRYMIKSTLKIDRFRNPW